MFALQSIVQQQGSHQQIFLPPRAPQLMQKVWSIAESNVFEGVNWLSYNATQFNIQQHAQYLQSGPPPMSATPPNKRGRSPSPTPQYYKTNNPPYPPTPSKLILGYFSLMIWLWSSFTTQILIKITCVQQHRYYTNFDFLMAILFKIRL